MVERNTLTGGTWPPKPAPQFQGTFDPWGLPLVNTLILLLSGTTVTWAHHALLEGDRKNLVRGLAITVILGVLFTACQAYEYGHAAFNYSGHIYGATFFMATGFHGAHVIIGTIFLAVCLYRAYNGAFTPKAALRLRGGRLVLALRRRGLAVPVRLHLRLGRGHPGPALTPIRRSSGRVRRRRIAIPGTQHKECRRLDICSASGVWSLTERDRIALKAALTCACPRCGEGPLFAGPLTLTLAPRCSRCDLDYAFIDSGDGPAVFGIFILGFLVLGAALLVEFKLGPPMWVHIVLWGPVTFILAFLLLRLLKATLVALQVRHAAGEGRLDRK